MSTEAGTTESEEVARESRDGGNLLTLAFALGRALWKSLPPWRSQHPGEAE